MFINSIPDDITCELNKVKQIILDCSQSISDSKLITLINTHITTNHGKMLRPLLLLLFAKIYNSNSDHNIILAAVIELIHIASLLHDDVLDNATMRRDQTTVNAMWDNKHAILAGDFLYSRAFQLLGQLEGSAKSTIYSFITNTANLMVEGEILQLSEQNNFDLTEENYLKIINYKTANLFALSVQLPGISLNMDVGLSLDFGLNFGMFYQLINDIEDYYKSGNDLKEGRITLPIIYVLNNIPPDLKLALKSDLAINSKSQNNLFNNIILQYGGFDYAINLAQHYLNKAKHAMLALNNIKNFKNSEYINIILQMLD